MTVIVLKYLEETQDLFRGYKQMAESAMAQVSDSDLVRQLDGESNSVAIIAKHIGGNLSSRWTDFLTTDGEKADRRRDSEFMDPARTRDEMMARGTRAGMCCFLRSIH